MNLEKTAPAKPRSVTLFRGCTSSYKLGIEFGILKVLHWCLSCKVLMGSEVVVFLDGFLELASDLC